MSGRGKPLDRKLRTVKKNFGWPAYFCLCFSESFSIIGVAAVLHVDGAITLKQAVALWLGLNAIGYLKYVYQMRVNREYVTLSYYIYIVAWGFVSYWLKNPLYILLYYYAMFLLSRIRAGKTSQAEPGLRYGQMAARGTLYNENSIAVHCVEHLMHGLVSLRLLVLYYDPVVFVILEPFVMYFVCRMSKDFLRIQTEYFREST